MSDHVSPQSNNPLAIVLAFVSISLNISHLKLAEIDAEYLAPIGRIIAITVGLLSIDGFLNNHRVSNYIKGRIRIVRSYVLLIFKK